MRTPEEVAHNGSEPEGRGKLVLAGPEQTPVGTVALSMGGAISFGPGPRRCLLRGGHFLSLLDLFSWWV